MNNQNDQLDKWWNTIQDLVSKGFDAKFIAKKLNIPVEWVYIVEDDYDAEFAN